MTLTGLNSNRFLLVSVDIHYVCSNIELLFTYIMLIESP